MYDQRLFAPRTRRVIVIANEEASRFNQKHLGPEHLLIGILSEGAGAAANALVTLGVDEEAALIEALKVNSPQKGQADKYVPLASETRALLDHASIQARRSKQASIEPEDLLLALLHKKRGTASGMLRELGVTPEAVIEEMRRLMVQAAEEAKEAAMVRRIDYYDDPQAPAANSLVPSVNVFVVNDRDEVLMIRRSDNDNWAVPGGAVDLGESVPQAAVRETLEETGIHCEITGINGIYSDPKHIIFYTSDGEARQEFSLVFTARPLSGEPTPSDESKEVVWAPKAELAGYRMDRSMRLRVDQFLTEGPTHIG